MSRLAGWLRFVAVAAGYAIAFVAARRAFTFSLESAWFVCLAMVCFLGLASTTRPIIRIRMPRPLRTIRAWEERRLSRPLRVPGFGGLLRGTPLRLLNRDVYLKGCAADPRRLAAELEAAEASHFWAAVLVVPWMVHAAIVGTWRGLFWVSLAQVLINVYPILHLRLVRGRLERARSRSIRRAEARADGEPAS
jgi:hypothetical protein